MKDKDLYFSLPTGRDRHLDIRISCRQYPPSEYWCIFGTTLSNNRIFYYGVFPTREDAVARLHKHHPTHTYFIFPTAYTALASIKEDFKRRVDYLQSAINYRMELE